MPERFRVVRGTPVRVALHNGDSFPESENAAPIARLRDAFLRSSDKEVPVRNFQNEYKRTLGSADVPGDGDLLLTVRTIPNFIELEPAKFLSYLKEEGLSDIISWRASHGEAGKPGRERYSKYSKALLLAGKPGAYFSHVAGMTIEIIPEKNPHVSKAGSSLPVQVLFRGAPAANLQMEAAWAGAQGKRVGVVGRTDASGRISVPLPQAGKWRLHTLKMERCAEPAAADWESFWATLTFEVI